MAVTRAIGWGAAGGLERDQSLGATVLDAADRGEGVQAPYGQRTDRILADFCGRRAPSLSRKVLSGLGAQSSSLEGRIKTPLRLARLGMHLGVVDLCHPTRRDPGAVKRL
jgi:hypothetical protein